MSSNIILGIPLIFLLCLIIGIIKPKLVVRWGAVEKRNRKKVFIYYGIALIIAVITSNLLFKTYGVDYASSEKYDASSYNTGITYEQLVRTPDNYKNKKVKFTGQVDVFVEDGNRVQLKIVVNNDSENILVAECKADELKQRFLKGDNITVSGRFIDIWSDALSNGEKIRLPAIWADNIDLNNSKTK